MNSIVPLPLLSSRIYTIGTYFLKFIHFPLIP